jgi:hypothetical protein
MIVVGGWKESVGTRHPAQKGDLVSLYTGEGKDASNWERIFIKLLAIQVFGGDFLDVAGINRLTPSEIGVFGQADGGESDFPVDFSSLRFPEKLIA